MLAGQSLDAVSKEYRIPKTTLHTWKKSGQVPTFGTQKDEEIGALLVDYLRANLRALQAQAVMFANPQWLREQGAQEAGILHGIMTDKAVRLIEAFSAHDSNSSAND